MIELNEPQQQALDQGQGEPLCVIDPRDQQAYVLLSRTLYERLQNSVLDSLEMKQVAALVAETMRDDDAEDPLLESYQVYKQQP